MTVIKKEIHPEPFITFYTILVYIVILYCKFLYLLYSPYFFRRLEILCV